MLKIKEYVRAENLEEAYQLNQSRGSRIIGGMLWLKMSNGQVQKAIDLSRLGLDKIEETDGEFSIGCMTTLRQIEEHPGLDRYTNGAVKECVGSIVGVQFRNLATVGGSIFGRFGFSDVLTLFMALDSYAELYQGGTIPLPEFVKMGRDRDILVRLIVKKTPVKCAYLSYRNTKTDFPVLTCAVSRDEKGARAVVGARPGVAVVVPIVDGDTDAAAETIPMGSNMRAGAAYRSHLAKVLIKRGLASL